MSSESYKKTHIQKKQPKKHKNQYYRLAAWNSKPNCEHWINFPIRCLVIQIAAYDILIRSAMNTFLIETVRVLMRYFIITKVVRIETLIYICDNKQIITINSMLCDLWFIEMSDKMRKTSSINHQISLNFNIAILKFIFFFFFFCYLLALL